MPWRPAALTNARTFMNTPLPPSFDSYQTGARAVSARSLGTLALGATALAGLPSEADAQISVFTFPNPPNSVSAFGSNMYLYFTVQTGESSASAFSGFSAVMGAAHNTDNTVVSAAIGTYRVTWAGVAGSPQATLSSFSPWASISGAATFFRYGLFCYASYNGSNVAPGWDNSTAYAGFRDVLGDGTHYGWAKITTSDHGAVVTLDAIGFNNVPGEAIAAGQTVAVPEPAASAALLALGAAGLAAYRQRKKIARAA